MIYLLVGFLAGALGSMTGLGGGIIIVPVLAILFVIPIHKAIGISIFVIVVNSTIASVLYAKQGYVDFKLGIAMEQSAVIGAIIGAFLSGIVKEKMLSYFLVVILIIASIQMMSPLKHMVIGEDVKIRKLSPIYRINNIKYGVPLTVIAGCVAGMLGVGGGIFNIPIMYLIMQVPIKVAVATSSFIIMLTSVASAWIFFLRGDIYIEIAIVLSMGAALGSYLGSKMGIKLKSKWQTRLIALLLIIAAIKMLF